MKLENLKIMRQGPDKFLVVGNFPKYVAMSNEFLCTKPPVMTITEAGQVKLTFENGWALYKMANVQNYNNVLAFERVMYSSKEISIQVAQ